MEEVAYESTEKTKQMEHILAKIKAFKEIYGFDEFFIWKVKEELKDG